MVEAPSSSPYIKSWPKKLGKLQQCVASDMASLKRHRKERKAMVQQYVGKYFSSDGSRDKVPLNMIELVVQVWISHLAARSPQVAVYPKLNPQDPADTQGLRASAEDLQRALNPLLETDMRLGSTLSDAVLEAMFSPLSVVKVGLGKRAQVEIDGFMHDYGKPFCNLVDLDDFVVDLRARRWDLINYIGDRYTIPLEYIRESGEFKNVDEVQPHDSRQSRYDEHGQGKLRNMSRGENQFDEDWEPLGELQDLWLPQHNLLVTFAVGGNWEKPVKEVEWDGPEIGPYHKLSFVRVPGQPLLGNPPLALIRDLHEAANTLYNKIVRRADKSKEIIGYTGQQQTDAERIRDAQDMEMVRLDTAAGLKRELIGGVDTALYGLVQGAMQQAKMQAGNIDLIGGLGAMSATATQDRLLSANASKRMAAMQDQVMEWTHDIVKSIAFYVWEDPILEMPITRDIPGTNLTLTYGWGPQHRESSFLNYNFEIVPYSMAQRTPGEKLGEIISLWQNVLLPMAQAGMLQARGKQLDVDGFLELLGNYGGLKNELKRIIIDTMPISPPQGPAPGIASSQHSPPVVTKTNVRVSGERSGPGKVTDQITQLMGGKLSPQQSAKAAS